MPCPKSQSELTQLLLQPHIKVLLSVSQFDKLDPLINFGEYVIRQMKMQFRIQKLYAYRMHAGLRIFAAITVCPGKVESPVFIRL